MGLFDLIAIVRQQRAHRASIKDAVRLVQRCARARVAYTKPESAAAHDEQFVTDLIAIQTTLDHLLSGPRGDHLHGKVHESLIALLMGVRHELDVFIEHEPMAQSKEDADSILFMIGHVAEIIREVLQGAPGSDEYSAPS